jgi:hypothetical protein
VGQGGATRPRGDRTAVGSGIRPRPRIDQVLSRPEVQALFETVKHHFAVAIGFDIDADPVRHRAAAQPAVAAVNEIVTIVQSDPANARLPASAIGHYIINRAYAELTAPIASEDQRRQHYLAVFLPPGRPPTRRPRQRALLLDELRRRPGMSDTLLKDRAISLGVWTFDQANDPRNIARRLRRLRDDATK